MKNAYHFLPALAALLAAAPAAHAQQAWQPFRAGLVCQYTETGTLGDTTHTLQLAPGAPVAGSPDTVYRFNQRVPRGVVYPSWAGGGTGYQLVADNLFGATLRAQPGAVFVLAAANGRTLTLRPRTPLGQNWAAGPAGLTGHVISRGLAPVLGGTPDSVALIMLSDGQNIRLSKRHGLLDGPSLDSYLNGRNRQRSLSLTALDGRGSAGTLVVGPRAAYDFQPGDLFQRHGTFTTLYGSLCSQTWTQDSVLTRRVSRTGDSVTYTIRTRMLSRSYGSAGAPAGFCSSTGSSYTNAVNTQLVTANAATPPSITNTFTAFTSGQSFGMVGSPAFRGSRYLRRFEWQQQLCQAMGNSALDSMQLSLVLDNSQVTRYGNGLGRTFNSVYSFGDFTEETLVAYRKGPEVWGTFFSFRQLLAARTVLPAATTAAFPQPFGASLMVKFDLARPQPVRLALHDALGRTVLAQPAAPLAAGPQQLVLATSHLPTGLYTLHIELLGEGRSEVLKVVRGE